LSRARLIVEIIKASCHFRRVLQPSACSGDEARHQVPWCPSTMPGGAPLVADS